MRERYDTVVILGSCVLCAIWAGLLLTGFIIDPSLIAFLFIALGLWGLDAKLNPPRDLRLKRLEERSLQLEREAGLVFDKDGVLIDGDPAVLLHLSGRLQLSGGYVPRGDPLKPCTQEICVAANGPHAHLAKVKDGLATPNDQRILLGAGEAVVPSGVKSVESHIEFLRARIEKVVERLNQIDLSSRSFGSVTREEGERLVEEFYSLQRAYEIYCELEAREKIRKEFEAEHSGRQNAHKPIVLNGLSGESAEGGLVQFLSVPQHYIGHPISSWQSDGHLRLWS